MMRWFAKRSVASITAPITAIVADLRKLMDEKAAEASHHRSLVEKYNALQGEAETEIVKAIAAAKKFEDLFS